MVAHIPPPTWWEGPSTIENGSFQVGLAECGCLAKSFSCPAPLTAIRFGDRAPSAAAACLVDSPSPLAILSASSFCCPCRSRFWPELDMKDGGFCSGGIRPTTRSNPHLCLMPLERAAKLKSNFGGRGPDFCKEDEKEWRERRCKTRSQCALAGPAYQPRFWIE